MPLGDDVMDNIKYNLNNIKNMKFKSEDIPNLHVKEKIKSACRLTDENIAVMPGTTEDNIKILRKKISNLFYERINGNFDKLEAFCDIKKNTYQKMMREQNGRNITYKQLAKFCIGLKISIGVTKELFDLMGHTLCETNRPDFILLCEIANKGSINDYRDSMLKYCAKNILSDAE